MIFKTPGTDRFKYLRGNMNTIKEKMGVIKNN